MNITIPQDKISALCKKWSIVELAVFGSALREDFDSENSDLDLLVSFSPDFVIGWEIVFLKEELEDLFQRPVDLVIKKALERSSNPYRKKSILDSKQVIYEQAS